MASAKHRTPSSPEDDNAAVDGDAGAAADVVGGRRRFDGDVAVVAAAHDFDDADKVVVLLGIDGGGRYCWRPRPAADCGTATDSFVRTHCCAGFDANCHQHHLLRCRQKLCCNLHGP